MQKITLKPSFKELIFKTDDPQIACDVFSYSGTSNQEKSLGSLFLITHASFDDQEDMSYVVSLISSLAKREFYSANAVKSQDAKEAFERTLKKLNEVLEDFFDNKALKLNIGLVALQNNNIYISKLGKFKVALARQGEYIDVLNNVALFEKSAQQEEQFSNIISGTLKSDDRLFAYFPTRAITSREKRLNKIFVADTQEAFLQELENISQTAKNFSCCGIYASVEEIKEIPLESKPSYAVVSESQSVDTSGPKSVTIDDQDNDETQLQPTPAHGVSAEVSRGQRNNWMTNLRDNVARARNIHSFDTPRKIRFFAIIAAIIIVPIIIVVIVTGGPSDIEIARDKAQMEYDQAKELIAQGNEKQARVMLSETLATIENSEDKEILVIRMNITETLSEINNISTATPTAITTYTGEATLSHIAHSEDDIHLVSDQGDLIYLRSDGTFKENESFDATPLDLFGTDERMSFVTQNDELAVFNILTKNTGVFDLTALSSSVVAYGLFGDNLYALTESSIFRYANATTGSTTFDQWLDTTLASTPLDLAIDGSIYVLTSDGMVETYFRGALDATFDTGLSLSSDATIHTGANGANIYILDAGFLYVFTKDSNDLQTTYELGDVDDITILDNDTIWILNNNQILSL